MDPAHERCKGRLASVLETLITGGAAAGATAATSAEAGMARPGPGAAGSDTAAVIDAVRREHAAFRRFLR